MNGVVSAEAVIATLRDRLLAAGLVNEMGWERALRARAETGERLEQVLVKLGLAPETKLADLLADILGMRRVQASDFPAEPIDLGPVSFQFLLANEIAPVADTDDALLFAVADPLDEFAIDALRQATGRKVAAVVGAPSDIRAALNRLYAPNAKPGRAESAAGGSADEDVERLRDLASEAPIIRLVNDVLDTAMSADASDVHLEPEADCLRVRYRVDGMLRDQRTLPLHDAQAVVSRVKIMARLNIAERRLPQDGRIKTTNRGREIDLRVSTVPALHGEAVVMRILDRSSQKMSLAELGLEPNDEKRLNAMLAQPNGVILVTGPTGSGKTTTLYAALLETSTPQVKVLTVEDPVEYRLPRAVQVQTKADIGLSFASALRSFLRHDPDIIMIGEIRDVETAEIAVQASLTGHLVLSTLHTNSAAGAVSRLADMGVERFLLSATLSGLVAQRLVRRLCGACREPIDAAPTDWLGRSLESLSGGRPFQIWRARGCAECNGSGYRGRQAIMEVLPVTDAVRTMIHDGAGAHEIERQAIAEGMTTLRDAGLRLALGGVTTLEEVARVTREV